MDLIDKTSRYKQSIQKIDYVITDYDMSDIGKMAIVCSILKSECDFKKASITIQFSSNSSEQVL